MKKYCYLKRKIFNISEVSSGFDDIGFLRDYGIFEVLRTYFLKPFLLEGHLNRFESSANLLGLNHFPSREEIGLADEAFITATNKEVIPVTMVGEEIVGTGFVGDKVKTIMNLFKERVKNHAN